MSRALRQRNQGGKQGAYAFSVHRGLGYRDCSSMLPVALRKPGGAPLSAGMDHPGGEICHSTLKRQQRLLDKETFQACQLGHMPAPLPWP